MGAMDLDFGGAARALRRTWRRRRLRWYSGQLTILPIFAAASLTIALFALTPATTRLAEAQIDGLWIGIIRSVGACVITIPLLLLLKLTPPKKTADWCLLIVSAFGSFAVFPVLFSIGAQRTSGSHAALIMAVMPLLVGCTGMLLDRRLPRPSWFMGAAIAIAGEIALIGLRGGGASNATAGGDAIVLVGCIFFALGVVAGARLSSRTNSLSATLWAITIGSVGLVPLAIVHWQTTAIDYHAFTATTWTAVFHITVGATIIANLTWLWALSRGGLVRVAPLQFSQPVCALFFAAALLGERLNLTLILVAAVIVFGTVTACCGARTATNKGVAPRNTWPTKDNVPAVAPVEVSRALVQI